MNNEPFVDENVEDQSLIEKLNSFADSNYKINEQSVFKKISWANFFSTKESKQVPEASDEDEEEEEDKESEITDANDNKNEE